MGEMIAKAPAGRSGSRKGFSHLREKKPVQSPALLPIQIIGKGPSPSSPLPALNPTCSSLSKSSKGAKDSRRHKKNLLWPQIPKNLKHT